MTFLPTEPTADSLDAVPFVGPTSNQVYAGSFKLSSLVTPNQAYVGSFDFSSWVTPSDKFKFGAKQSTADDLLLRSFRDAAVNQDPPRTEHVLIDDLGEAGYRILQPISVKIRRVEIGDFEASFREANIAMSGSDSHDAFQALVAEILETFDVLLREQHLGPDAAEQRRILHTYIVRA